MDPKGRIAIPAKQRECLASISNSRVVLTAHTQNRCVLIYPENEWDVVSRQIQALPNYNKHIQRAQRLLIGYATPTELDGNGRVHVSQTLRDYAGLEKELILVGLGKKFELWSETAWVASVADADLSDEPMPPELLSLSY
jgi:MraZ protein